MAFNLHDFVMKTIKGMFGNEPEYKVNEYALKWLSKGVLTEEDLAEIESWYAVPEVPEETEAEEIQENDILEEDIFEEGTSEDVAIESAKDGE